MVTVIFPTAYEAEDFLKACTQRQRQDIDGVECHTGQLSEVSVQIIICGIGPKKSADSVTRVFRQAPPSLVILSGFAGALSGQLERGQILVATDYSSGDLVNYIKLIPGFDIGRLYTSDRVIGTVEEKKRLGETTGCQMVDMEMAAVSEIVRQYGVEILGIRAISDLAHEPVPVDVLNKGYDQIKGKTTPVKMALFLLLQPHRIKDLKKFLEPLPAVRKKLTHFLIAAVEEFE
jgi:adenosylhomocysteine nucleosidase